MVILNQYYIDGILVYFDGEVRCAECDEEQEARLIKSEFGMTIGFNVDPDGWYHSPNCKQPANFKAEPIMSPDPTVQARNEQTIEDDYLDPI